MPDEPDILEAHGRETPSDLAVDNARLYREAREARVRAERLQAVTTALAGALTPADVARALVAEGLPAFGVDAGSVFALDDEGRTFVLLDYVGYAPEDEPRYRRVPNDRPGPLQDAAASRALVTASSPREMVDRWPHLAEMQTTSGDAAVAAAPLLLDSRVLGVLYVAFRRPRRFSAEDHAFLTTLAGQGAQALERARLHEAEREARARLSVLAEAGALLATSLDYETTLHNVTRLATPRLADWCAIYALGEDGALRRETLTHADPEQERLMRELFTYPLDTSMDIPIARVARTGQPEVNAVAPLPPVATTDPALARRVERMRPRSSLLVPLSARGHIIGVLGLFITGRRRRYTETDVGLAEELSRRAALALDNARLYREAREAIALRDQFLSVAAHELKTPLTSLLGNAQLLERRLTRAGALTERDARALAALVAQARHQRALVEALLDLSQLQDGGLIVERVPVDVCAVTRRAVEWVRPGLGNHKLTCATPDEPLVVAGDEGRLEQIVYNLISNALKYSPDGGMVALRVAREGDSALLDVRDQGVGIPRDAMRRLFEPFYRASNADPRHISGLGLGLYLVKEIAARHGGEVAVDSAEGQGTTVRVRLPLLVEGRPGAVSAPVV